MPTNISPSEPEGTKWMKLQLWVRQACENAGITAGGDDPLLSNISQADSEGVKWAKLQRWVALLAENISGGGGGGGGGGGEVANSFQLAAFVGGDPEAPIDGYNIEIVPTGKNHYVFTTISGSFTNGPAFSLAAGTYTAGQTITVLNAAGASLPDELRSGPWVPEVPLPTWIYDGSAWVQYTFQVDISATSVHTFPAMLYIEAGELKLDGGAGVWCGLNFQATLTENITSIITANMPHGVKATLTFVQDSTGGRSVTFPSSWTFAGGVPPVIDKTPGAVTVIDLIVSDWYPAAIHASARAPQHRSGIIEVTATRDIAATDADSYLYSTSAGAVTLTVQASTLPIGAEVDIFQEGAGQVTIAAGAGVTIVSKDGNLKLSATGSGASLKHVHDETYHLVGDLTA